MLQEVKDNGCGEMLKSALRICNKPQAVLLDVTVYLNDGGLLGPGGGVGR